MVFALFGFFVTLYLETCSFSLVTMVFNRSYPTLHHLYYILLDESSRIYRRISYGSVLVVLDKWSHLECKKQLGTCTLSMLLILALDTASMHTILMVRL